jgi:hypothetical protein
MLIAVAASVSFGANEEMPGVDVLPDDGAMPEELVLSDADVVLAPEPVVARSLLEALLVLPVRVFPARDEAEALIADNMAAVFGSTVVFEEVGCTERVEVDAVV